MKSIVTDTSAWYALINRHDAHHQAARKFLKTHTGRFLTTNYCVAETTNLVLMRLGAKRAVQWLDLLRQSQLVDIICLTSEQHEQTTHLFIEHAHQGLSFTDCSSILVIQKQKDSQAFCFDRGFRCAGVACVP